MRAKWAAAVMAASVCVAMVAEPLPQRLSGTWRITRVLNTNQTACWNHEQAAPLVGSTLTYREDAMRWQGGEVSLQGITTRTVTAPQFSKENPGSTFQRLGVHTGSVLEVDMQHEDMDITGATTEVPGDSVLVVSPNRIVVSACGVYFEATRSGGVERASR